MSTNIAGYFSGYTGVQNINSRIIVYINWSRGLLVKNKFQNDISQEPISLDIIYNSNKICFCGTKRIDLFSFRPINNCTPIKRKSKYSSGSPLDRLISIRRFHKTYQLSLINFLLGFGDIFIPYNWMVFGL